eukprot:gene15324-16901_t
MARFGSLLQQDWQETREGKEFTSGILQRNRRRMFGLIDSPVIPVSLKAKEVSYKIFLLGKAGVGKTSIVSKLVGREVPTSHTETPGIQMSIVYWPGKCTDDLQESKGISRKSIRDFENVWKIPVLRIANVDRVKFPDGDLDGRASIKDIAPFLNRLVELLWAHDQMSSGIPGVSRPIQREVVRKPQKEANSTEQLENATSVMTTNAVTAISQVAAIKKPGNVPGNYDDNEDRRSINSKRSIDKLTITYC